MLHAPVFLRPFATGFAGVLALLGAWIVAAEVTGPGPTSAMMGWPRGDVWSGYAISANAASIEAVIGGRPAPVDDSASKISETAALLRPSDASSWLLLAISAQAAANDSKTTALLKMSYYTSPYSDALFPLRIQTASRATSMSDEELVSYIEYELGVVIGSKPDLKPSVIAAYRSASRAGRMFLDNAVKKLDPAFLAELKAAKP